MPLKAITTPIESHVALATLKPLPGIKNIIAIASGKGGVGKSTVAVNLALALALEGAVVGLLDADIYGPSQPTLLGLQSRPEIKNKKQIMPLRIHGIQMMSIGLLVDEQAALVWRGPMISMAMQQLLNDTVWENVDYLIVDLPPGTGDIQLSLAQKAPLSGVVLVTTPQELALKDVRRAAAMFEKLKIPIFGVVENMAGQQCSYCGHAEAPFGEGGAEQIAQEFKTKVLGRFPLDKSLGDEVARGLPLVIREPESVNAANFRAFARALGERLALEPKSYAHKFPTIKVE